jgi:hypothetical protein
MGVRVTPDLDTINSLPVKADVGVEREPDITFDGSNYVVVWSEGVFGGEHKVRAARVTTQGVVLDSGIIFGKDSYLEYRPSIAYDGTRFLAVWYSYTTPFGVFGRFLNSQAQPDGDAIDIRLSSTNHFYQPDIAFANDRYLVIWNEQTPYTGDDVFGQLVDPDGTMYGGIIPISTGSGYQSNPRVTGGNDFLVVWDESGKICGQRVSEQGQLIGPNFQISDTLSRDRQYPDIAKGTDGYLAAWMEYNNTSYDIYGNIDIVTGFGAACEQNLKQPPCHTTITRGTLARFLGQGYTLYDIAGRNIEHNYVSSGIYFLEKDGRIITKIIKVQ